MNRLNSKKYATNPFMLTLLEASKPEWKSRMISSGNNIIVLNTETNDIEGHGAIIAHEKTETNQFIKVFREGFMAITSLHGAAQTLIQLIGDGLYSKDGIGKTKVILNYDMLSDDTKKIISKRSFYRGISDCVKAGIIAESIDRYTFFLNPTYLFNGDRLKKLELFINNPQEFEKEQALIII